MQSSAKATGRPSCRAMVGTRGASDSFGSRPFGRPKCDISTIRAPPRASSWTVGASRSIRDVSVTCPSRTGTLRSARSSTFLPRTSSPSSVRILAISGFLETRLQRARKNHATGRGASFAAYPWEESGLAIGETVGGGDQRRADARLEGRVSRIGDDDIFGLGPGAMESVCRRDRADQVVAALYDDGRDMPNAIDALEQRVARLEQIVAKKMRFDPRKADSVALFAGRRQDLRVGQERGAGAFVNAPRPRCRHAYRGIGIVEPPTISFE